MKKQSTSKGFAIMSIATVLQKVLSLLYLPFLIKILGGDSTYSVYYAAYQIYVFIFVLTNSGIPVAISKLVSEFIAVNNYRDAVKSFKISRFVLLIMGTVMGTLLFLLAKPFSNAMKFPKAYLAVMALSPAVLCTSVSSAYRGYFQGRGNMTPTAVSQVLEQIVNTVFSLIFAAMLLRYGVEVACAGATIGTTLGAFISAVYLVITYEENKHFRVPREYYDAKVVKHTNKQILRRIINYGVPITLSVGMQNAGNIIDTGNTKSRLLTAGFSDDKASGFVGMVAKYQTLMNVPIAIISTLAMTILPAISGAVAVKDKRSLSEKINYAFKMCFLISIPSAVGFSIMSMPVYKLLFPSYLEGYKIMFLGSTVLIFMSVMLIQTSILQGIGKIYKVTIYSILGIAIKIATNYILIAMPKINVYGTILGSILGYSTVIFLNHRLMKRAMKIRFNMLRHIVKPTIASLIMGGAVCIVYTVIYVPLNMILPIKYIVNFAALMMAGISGIIVYFLALILIKGIKKEDVEGFPAKIRRRIPKAVMAMMK